jgi:hypothetical protein
MVRRPVAAQAAPAVEGLYLLHFDPPYLHAGHRMGWSTDIRARVLEHVRGGPKGSPLVAAAVAAGCRVWLARVWIGHDRTAEARMLRANNGPRFCPICQARGRA